jgi:hypothetical protein
VWHYADWTHDDEETVMAGKNKGGREARKPKADKNKKQTGQTPSAASPALEHMNNAGRPPKK